jgi:hypothetical protein
VADLVLELLEQEVLGLRGRQAGRALERGDVALVRVRGLLLALGERVLAAFELRYARLERLLAREPDAAAAVAGSGDVLPLKP